MKFKKGEIVDCVFGINQGFQVEILEVGPFSHEYGGSSDYICTAPAVCGRQYYDESSLRKRRPPEQKSAFSYDEIIAMCNDRSITQPSEVGADG